jgi:hypothetical protein
MEQRRRDILFNHLNKIESELDVLGIQVDNINIWPLVRHKLALEFMRVNNKKIEGVSGFLKRVKLFVKGGKELLQLLVYFFKPLSANFLFLTKSSYRTRWKNVWFDRFCDSIIASGGISFAKKALILEGSSDLEYRRPRASVSKVMEVQGVFYVIGFLSLLIRPLFKPKYSWTNFSIVRDHLTQLMSYDFKLSANELEKQFNRILLLSQVFYLILKRSKVKYVFVVCYYEEYSYALVLAANRLGISTIDIQHGVQGKYHFAYSPFATVPETGYSMLPRVFWTWDITSHDNISDWNTDKHSSFLIGNVWLSYFNSLTDFNDTLPSWKPIILLSLQPVFNPLSDTLLECIKISGDEFIWYLRLHPRQLSQRSVVWDRIKINGLQDFVNIDEATDLPLPYLLNKCLVHVTLFSSVVFEAEMMGTPSIIIHETGKLMYEDNDSTMFIFANDATEILEAIRFVQMNKQKTRLKNLIPIELLRRELWRMSCS